MGEKNTPKRVCDLKKSNTKKNGWEAAKGGAKREAGPRPENPGGRRGGKWHATRKKTGRENKEGRKIPYRKEEGSTGQGRSEA